MMAKTKNAGTGNSTQGAATEEVELLLDEDVVVWLKKDGQDIETRVNGVLREEMLKEMELTPRKGGARPRGKGRPGRTTVPGTVNRRGQEVVGPTGRKSESREDQTIHHMRCQRCGHEYGANGCDAWLRKCPECQGGKPGEPLVGEAERLF